MRFTRSPVALTTALEFGIPVAVAVYVAGLSKLQEGCHVRVLRPWGDR